jgi:hypothetical protein
MDAQPFQPPRAHYRCSVSSQISVELHNVTMQQRFVAGNPSAVGLSALGVAAMTLYGRARQKSLEGQVRFMEATGDAVLMTDWIVLHLVATGSVRGVTIKHDPAAQSVDYEIPYAMLKRWGTEPYGLYLDVFGLGVIWLRPHDNGEFAQWLAHLSHNKTWRPPTPIDLTPKAPVVNWCQQDPRFTFGIPDGWGTPNPYTLAQYAPNFAPNILRAAIITEVADWETQVFVIEGGGEYANAPTDPESLAIDAGFTRITRIGPMQSTRLNGEPTILVRGTSSTATGVFDRTYTHTTHNGIHWLVWYGVVGGTLGDGSHERWLPHLYTMLATWHWYT